MVAELNVLNEWIPEQMQPGTIFVLENAGRVGEKRILTGPCSHVPTAAPWASSPANNSPACCP